jgi:hypothetical protein
VYVEIRMTNADTFEVQEMPDEDSMALVEEWQALLRRTDGSETLVLTLDETNEKRASIVHLNAREVSSIELTPIDD